MPAKANILPCCVLLLRSSEFVCLRPPRDPYKPTAYRRPQYIDTIWYQSQRDTWQLGISACEHSRAGEPSNAKKPIVLERRSLSQTLRVPLPSVSWGGTDSRNIGTSEDLCWFWLMGNINTREMIAGSRYRPVLPISLEETEVSNPAAANSNTACGNQGCREVLLRGTHTRRSMNP